VQQPYVSQPYVSQSQPIYPKTISSIEPILIDISHNSSHDISHNSSHDISHNSSHDISHNSSHNNLNNESMDLLSDLKNQINELKNQLQFFTSNNNKNISNEFPDLNCAEKIDIVKKELLTKIDTISDKYINNYVDLLCDDLIKQEILSLNEVQNIKYKIKNNLVDVETIVSYLENKKQLSKQLMLSENSKYSDLNYNYKSLLDGKWQIPMPRPPVCISDGAQLTQYDKYDSTFSKF